MKTFTFLDNLSNSLVIMTGSNLISRLILKTTGVILENKFPAKINIFCLNQKEFDTSYISKRQMNL